jgi:hypothetical protein
MMEHVREVKEVGTTNHPGVAKSVIHYVRRIIVTGINNGDGEETKRQGVSLPKNLRALNRMTASVLVWAA